jgi:hypothetical protein
MELVSNVSVGVGAAALVGGIAMIIFGGPTVKPAPGASLVSGASIAVSPGEARVGYGLSF